MTTKRKYEIIFGTMFEHFKFYMGLLSLAWRKKAADKSCGTELLVATQPLSM